jgi:hypothetical protein
MTTMALAHLLGRSRQSLYYHLGLMERAGLVAAESPSDGTREHRFRLRSSRLAAGAARNSMKDRDAAAKAVGAILRLTSREASAALTDPATRVEGALRDMIALRGKARLGKPALLRARKLIAELEALFRSEDGDSGDLPLYALTLVLTPAREADGYERDSG